MTLDQPPVDLDDWDFEEELQAVERLMRSLHAAGLVQLPSSQNRALVTHLAHPAIPPWHVPQRDAATISKRTESQPKRKPATRIIGLFAWLFLLLGLMTFVCGAVLLGWSVVEDRDELWTIGLPLSLGGQAILLIGLLIQLEGLWQKNSETNSTLDELDEKLHELRHTTTLLSAGQSNPAQSFYVHMAEGASPQLLLADLKGQLDMLAVKLADDRR